MELEGSPTHRSRSRLRTMCPPPAPRPRKLPDPTARSRICNRAVNERSFGVKRRSGRRIWKRLLPRLQALCGGEPASWFPRDVAASVPAPGRLPPRRQCHSLTLSLCGALNKLGLARVFYSIGSLNEPPIIFSRHACPHS
jgi:hypothetical protein